MILQRLCEYYDRLAEDPDSGVAPSGYVVQGIAFAVVLDANGDLVGIHDVREMNDRGKPRNRLMVLPGKAKPSGSGMNPSLWGWDRTDYMLGYLDPETLKESERARKVERCSRAHEEYKKAMLAREEDINEPDYAAFCAFLRRWRPEMAADHPLLKEVSGSFGVVRYTHGPPRYLHDLPNFRDETGTPSGVMGRCLVTGEEAPIARIHDVKIKGVSGAQSSGATLVGFNQDSFESRGHSQSYNAPVGEPAAFKYATALNRLLLRDGRHRVQVGDATCVFWADRPSQGETLFQYACSETLPNEDSDTVLAVENTLRDIKNGVAHVPDAEVGFHVLGLSPNQSRLSVRFWHSGTLGEMLERVGRHQRELEIVRGERDRGILPVWLLLAQTAREAAEIPPLLGGALLRAILTGGPYPLALYGAVLRRIRADRKITHPRAAAIKSVLTRNYKKEDLTMLNRERPETAYHLGRLFAGLEKTQQDALPGINATIKDRYFGSASATPGAVFPRLIRMSQHHIGKLEGGAKVYAEKRIQEICGRIDAFPAHLDMVGQGLFALGYYHQRQDFFTKKPAETEAPEAVPA